MIQTQPLSSAIDSGFTFFSMAIHGESPMREALEASFEYKQNLGGGIGHGLALHTQEAAKWASGECPPGGRSLCRPNRWGINE